VVYVRTGGFGFVEYDDVIYLSSDSKISEGLTWGGLKWAFSAMFASNWMPLTWLSLMIDRQFFGQWAGGFHLVNVLLHIANSILVFLVLNRYTKSLWPGFFVAVLFGLHPLHVESVAWVAERKDVLSTLFWLLTMLAYVRYMERPTAGSYVLIIVFYALGLMAKPMLVTLPFVLIVMDYWPLRRLWPGSERQANNDSAEIRAGVSISLLILEKLPLFILSGFSCVVTFIAQKSGGAMVKVSSIPFGQRVGNALVSYVSYVLKMFWPVDLAVLYPHPKGGLAGWKVAVAVTILMAITVVVLLLRRRRYLLAGWLWYLGTLIPVIGIVQVGIQAMADRYTYIPLTGVFIMLVWLVSDIISGWRHRGVFVGMVGSALILLLGFLSFRQVGYWHDSITLFSRTAAITKDNVFIRNHLGSFYADRGDIEAAKREFEIVLGIKPDDFFARGHLGVLFAENGDLEAGMREFEIVLETEPNDIYALYNLGKSMSLQGRTDEAIEYYNRVLEIEPGHTEAYCALSLIQAEQGQFQRAIDLYREGLGQNPRDGRLHGGLGLLFLQMGRVDEAIEELETAIELKEVSEAYVNLGIALSFKGDADGAMKCWARAIQIDPANAEAHYNLGNSFLSRGRYKEAVEEYNKAIELKPDYVKAYGNIAISLAQMGRYDEALEKFRQAVEVGPDNPDAHFNLASALEKRGFIEEAVEHLNKVVALRPQDTIARCRLGELLLRLGRIEQAISEYEQALKFDSDNKEARVGLEKAQALQSRGVVP